MTFEEIAKRSEDLAGEIWCPICQARMRFHDSELGRWPSVDPVTYINNVQLKCAKCKFLARFGIQVSKEWFDEEVKLRGNRVRTISIFDPDFLKQKDNEKQLERLRALGYL